MRQLVYIKPGVVEWQDAPAPRSPATPSCVRSPSIKRVFVR